MDRELNSESAINLSRSQRPSAATTPLNTASPIHEENDEPEVCVNFFFFKSLNTVLSTRVIPFTKKKTDQFFFFY